MASWEPRRRRGRHRRAQPPPARAARGAPGFGPRRRGGLGPRVLAGTEPGGPALRAGRDPARRRDGGGRAGRASATEVDTVQDFEDFLELLDRHDVRYLIIGGLAFIYHAKPRFTKDIDVWLDPEPDNLARANAALADFGSPHLLNLSRQRRDPPARRRAESHRPPARGRAPRVRRRLAPACRGHLRTRARVLDRPRGPPGGQGAHRPSASPGGRARAAPGARAAARPGVTRPSPSPPSPRWHEKVEVES